MIQVSSYLNHFVGVEEVAEITSGRRDRMKVKGLIWLGTRTARFAEMLNLYKNVMGMSVTHQEPGGNDGDHLGDGLNRGVGPV